MSPHFRPIALQSRQSDISLAHAWCYAESAFQLAAWLQQEDARVRGHWYSASAAAEHIGLRLDVGTENLSANTRSGLRTHASSDDWASRIAAGRTPIETHQRAELAARYRVYLALAVCMRVAHASRLAPEEVIASLLRAASRERDNASREWGSTLESFLREHSPSADCAITYGLSFRRRRGSVLVDGARARSVWDLQRVRDRTSARSLQGSRDSDREDRFVERSE